MTTYTLKKEEGKEDVVVKTGHSAEFTMSAVDKHMLDLAKLEKELTAQIELDGAKMTNVEENHPLVKDLKEVELIAVALYAQAWAQKKQCELKLKEVTEQQAEYKEEIVEIKKQTGIV